MRWRTPLAPGASGTFLFDSTTTPAQFAAQTGLAGQSTAYGVNAIHGQLSFYLSSPDTETFGLLAIGATGFFGFLRRRATPAA